MIVPRAGYTTPHNVQNCMIVRCGLRPCLLDYVRVCFRMKAVTEYTLINPGIHSHLCALFSDETLLLWG